MRNIKLTLSYDGTRYQGFSKPGTAALPAEKSNTVSARLNNTLHRLTGETVELFCGAKTEPGVHALEQTVSFRTACSLSATDILGDLNRYLPQDICVLSAEEMPERFHAALNAGLKTYEYHIYVSPVSDVFRRNTALHLEQMPDISAMQEAAQHLLGRHDFQYFSAGKAKKGKKNTEKELTSLAIQVSRADSAVSDVPRDIRIQMTGNDFLFRMPFLLTGTLLDIGSHARTPDCIDRIFAGEEPPGAPCAAQGLYLSQISY